MFTRTDDWMATTRFQFANPFELREVELSKVSELGHRYKGDDQHHGKLNGRSNTIYYTFNLFSQVRFSRTSPCRSYSVLRRRCRRNPRFLFGVSFLFATYRGQEGHAKCDTIRPCWVSNAGKVCNWPRGLLLGVCEVVEFLCPNWLEGAGERH